MSGVNILLPEDVLSDGDIERALEILAESVVCAQIYKAACNKVRRRKKSTQQYPRRLILKSK